MLDTSMLPKEVRESIKPMCGEELESVIFTYRGLHVEVFLPNVNPNGRELSYMVRKALKSLNEVLKDLGIKRMNMYNYIIQRDLCFVIMHK